MSDCAAVGQCAIVGTSWLTCCEIILLTAWQEQVTGRAHETAGAAQATAEDAAARAKGAAGTAHKVAGDKYGAARDSAYDTAAAGHQAAKDAANEASAQATGTWAKAKGVASDAYNKARLTPTTRSSALANKPRCRHFLQSPGCCFSGTVCVVACHVSGQLLCTQAVMLQNSVFCCCVPCR